MNVDRKKWKRRAFVMMVVNAILIAAAYLVLFT
jgi:hypothetical protein